MIEPLFHTERETSVGARKPGALHSWALTTVIVSALALGLLITARYVVPRWPASLIVVVVVASIFVSWAVPRPRLAPEPAKQHYGP